MKTTMQRDFEIEPVSLRRAWLINRACKPRQAVAHVAFQFGLRRQGGDGVDDEDIDRARANQGVGDLQSLLTGVRLRDEQIIDDHAELAGIDRVEGVLGIDKGTNALALLRFGDDMQRQGRLAGRFGSVNFDDAPARQTTNAKRDVQSERAGRNGIDVDVQVIGSKPHDRAFAKVLLDLREGGIERLLPVHGFPFNNAKLWRGHFDHPIASVSVQQRSEMYTKCSHLSNARQQTET